jgi:hypothetical protein
MKVKDRFPRKGEKYVLYLKPFSEIESISTKIDIDTSKDKTNIHHSTGHGGGLSLKGYFIKKYCGTGKSLKLEFRRQTNNRFLYETIHERRAILLYGEWLQEYPGNYFLENDLFEI